MKQNQTTEVIPTQSERTQPYCAAWAGKQSHLCVRLNAAFDGYIRQVMSLATMICGFWDIGL
jgi:hypothetical protein